MMSTAEPPSLCCQAMTRHSDHGPRWGHKEKEKPLLYSQLMELGKDGQHSPCKVSHLVVVEVEVAKPG